MSDTLPQRVNRRQFLTFGLAVAGGVVSLKPRRALADNPGNRTKAARWAFLSDLHIAARPDNHFRGFYPHRNLQKILGQITGDLPDGVIITGDLSRSRGDTKAYKNVRAMLAPVAAKRSVHLALGNHDHRGNFLHAFGLTGGRSKALGDRHIVTANAGPIRVIVLDTLLYVNMFPGLLGKTQRIWLETYLRLCDDRPTILFLHHTPRADLLDTRRLFDIIAPAKKVKAVVYGHSHKYEFCEFEGIQLINLPAAGYNFTNAQPVGWVEARLTDEGGEFTLHAVGGSLKRHGSTTAVPWRT